MLREVDCTLFTESTRSLHNFLLRRECPEMTSRDLVETISIYKCEKDAELSWGNSLAKVKQIKLPPSEWE